MDTSTLVSGPVLALLLFLAVVLLLVLVVRKTPDLSTVVTPLQGLTQVVGSLQAEMARLSERVATVERGQTNVSQGIGTISTQVAETGAVAQGIAETSSVMRGKLDQAQESLTSLQTRAAAREEVERQTAESIRRLEAIIAGTKTKGIAGENIIDLVFAQLPVDWQVRNFQVGNRTVEFGLRLPNNLVLPIDSKWTATNLVEQFLATKDLGEQQSLKAQIEKAVLAKAKEVMKYIDPSITVSFGIAAIPDAVFDLCSSIQAEILKLNVVLISYSMFVPYLLLAFQTFLKTSGDIDLQKLHGHLDTALKSLRSVQEQEVEGRLSKAVTMLGNSRDEIRSQLSRISTSLTAIQMGAGTPHGSGPAGSGEKPWFES